MLSLDDLLVLGAVSQNKPGPPEVRERLPDLVEAGVAEQIGAVQATKYILSRRLYSFLGKKGAYTRVRGSIARRRRSC